MKIASLQLYPVRVAYRIAERSAVVDTGGVSNVLVRLTTDDGLDGWGEACAASSTATVLAALQSMTPYVLGRSPWEGQVIARDVMVAGRWRYQAMTAAFAFAAIDMALWDLCGQASGQPLYRLLGGALRDTVDYFYYLQWQDDEGLAAQCRAGRAAGYEVFYLKVGEDARRDEQRLEVVRGSIGPTARLRIDANQAWTPVLARRLIERWHRRFDLDMVEGPIAHHPPQLMAELKRTVPVALCADEGLRGEDLAFHTVSAACADVLCLSPYDVGSLRAVQSLAWYAHRLGQSVCKHTWGELGIYAAAMQHLLLSLPNTAEGNQQTAMMMADDVLGEALPIASGPRWGLIEAPGLGVQVDTDKVAAFHEDYQRLGEYPRRRHAEPPRPVAH